jgi:hypothetical protein
MFSHVFLVLKYGFLFAVLPAPVKTRTAIFAGNTPPTAEAKTKAARQTKSPLSFAKLKGPCSTKNNYLSW